jgi:hypothetical protein
VNMPQVHKPTLLTAVVIIVVLFIAYHFLAGRKR